MPAKLLNRVSEEGTYSHIYNKGVENLAIFKDQEDYEVFLGFLRDYLTPIDSEAPKKVFTVNGRSFHGVPHQANNYFNKIELVAYGLTTNQFHLLLYQISKDSITNLMRSLSTRYSIYFNKKYKHSGTVFAGPYKSIHIKDELSILLLTHRLHRTGTHSSFTEYLGTKVTPWIKPDTVLSFFDKVKNDSFKGVPDYKSFVEKYEPGKEEKSLLEEISTEDESSKIEDSVRANDSKDFSQEKAIPDLKPRPKFFEYGAATAIFLMLLGVGVNNVNTSQAMNSTKPVVLSESSTFVTSPTPTPTPSESSEPKIIITIITANASASANIRKEPSLQSKIIGNAKGGETFESISIGTEWVEIKLDSGLTGFISSNNIGVAINNN